jgi:5-methylcytosine-specific restriction endonuclease McrA
VENGKKCTKCGEFKSLEEFFLSRTRRAGYSSHCKPCHCKYAKSPEAREKAKKYRDSRRDIKREVDRVYRETHKDKIKEQRKNAVLSQETVEFRKQYKRQWWEEKKLHVYDRQREWRRNNPDKATGPSLRWAAKNPLAVKAIKSRRGAKIRNADGVVTAQDLSRMLEEQGGLCNYCKKDISTTFTVDHIVPICKGGPHAPENVQLLCKSCNCRKSFLDEDVFLKRAGYETPQRRQTL